MFIKRMDKQIVVCSYNEFILLNNAKEQIIDPLNSKNESHIYMKIKDRQN